MTGIDVRPAGPDDASYVHDTLADGFGDTVVAGHGEMIDAAALPATVAWRRLERLGLLTYRSHPDETACEIVTINTHALRFYQRNGFDLTALSYDAVTLARKLKPSIPAVVDGIALRHELVLERRP